MLKKSSIVAFMMSLAFPSFAQTSPIDYIKSFSITHVSVSAQAGTMGVSLDATTPVNEWMNLRAGISWMPTISTTMGFGVQVGDKKENKYDENGNRIQTKFERMAEYMEAATGYKVDDRVDMDCKASFVNAKIMVDFLPFSNKDWHISAGFYWGTKTIGRACNSIEDMTTTMAVGIYNSIYEKIDNFEPIFSNNGISVSLPPEIEEKIWEYGRMGMHVGDFNSDGKPYMMVPAADGTVRAKAKVNSFKPYLGFGWDHACASYPEWRYGFDAGLVFWGGVPNVYTHDGTSLTKDVYNLDGKVGSVISFVKCFPVYPLLEFKISRTIF